MGKERRNDDGEGESYSASGREGIREGTVGVIAVASWDLEVVMRIVAAAVVEGAGAR